MKNFLTALISPEKVWSMGSESQNPFKTLMTQAELIYNRQAGHVYSAGYQKICTA